LLPALSISLFGRAGNEEKNLYLQEMKREKIKNAKEVATMKNQQKGIGILCF